MRKIKFLLIITGLMAIAASCKKSALESNPLADSSNFGIGSYLILDSTINVNINYSSIATSTAGIIVDENKGGQAVQNIVMYVAKTNTYDTTQWHVIKTVPFTGKGTVLSITGADLATALGVSPSALSPGTSYTVFNRAVTKSGAYWDVSNTGYANDGTNLISGTNYHSAFYFNVNIVCPFVAPMAGTYKVIEDDWQDWVPGNLVPVTDGPAVNELNLSQVWPNPAYGTVVSPLYCVVDPSTGVATVPAGIIWGNYGYLTSTLSGSGGNVFSCTGLISLSVHIFAAGYGDQGFLKLILQKQ